MLNPTAFIHPLADVATGARIGSGTRIWQFCVLLSGAVVGDDCNICAHCLIEGGVVVGSRVTIKSGVHLWEGVTLEDDVFVGPNATFTNDVLPRSRRPPPQYGRIWVGQGASIGANATVLPGVTVGSSAMVGAGAVVTRDIPDFALVVGNPARLHDWVCRCGTKLVFTSDSLSSCPCGRRFHQTAPHSVRELVT